MIKIETKIWKISADSVKAADPEIQEIAALLQEGQVIAFPTETVYGLGANALNEQAVEKIFTAKGRPSDNPLIVHIASTDQLADLVASVDKRSQKLIENFWPGPLTIVFPKKEGISSLISAGLPTIAVRMPSHPVALAIIRAANLPIAAPSANRSGRPSPTTAAHVLQDLSGLIAGVVDGGEAGIGVESTVIDVSGQIPLILRPGGITVEQLKGVIDEIQIDPGLLNELDKPKSPGMKYTHYAPNGEMWIISGSDQQKIISDANKRLQNAKERGLTTGVLTITDYQEYFTGVHALQAYGSSDDLYPLAEHLYGALRSFDSLGVEYIIAPAVVEEGIGLAIMNRMVKAAGGRIVNVDNL